MRGRHMIRSETLTVDHRFFPSETQPTFDACGAKQLRGSFYEYVVGRFA